MLSKRTAAALTASFITLCACAPMEPQAEKDAGTAPAAPATPPAPPLVQAAPEAAPAAPAIPNPAVVAFDERSIELDSDAQALVEKLVPSAMRSEKIVITGFSDRKKYGNAREIAIARGVRIKHVLVKNGVPAAKIRIHYTTVQPRNLAEVDLGELPLRVDNDAAAAIKN